MYNGFMLPYKYLIILFRNHMQYMYTVTPNRHILIYIGVYKVQLLNAEGIINSVKFILFTAVACLPFEGLEDVVVIVKHEDCPHGGVRVGLCLVAQVQGQRGQHFSCNDKQWIKAAYSVWSKSFLKGCSYKVMW